MKCSIQNLGFLNQARSVETFKLVTVTYSFQVQNGWSSAHSQAHICLLVKHFWNSDTILTVPHASDPCGNVGIASDFQKCLANRQIWISEWAEPHPFCIRKEDVTVTSLLVSTLIAELKMLWFWIDNFIWVGIRAYVMLDKSWYSLTSQMTITTTMRLTQVVWSRIFKLRLNFIKLPTTSRLQFSW